MKRAVLFFAVIGILPSALPAQDIHFSQFQETPLHINPANTGLFEGLYRGTLHYRSQWAVMGHPYQTMAAAFDAPILQKSGGAYMGIGAYVYRDKAGDSEFGTFQANVSVSGIVPLDQDSRLSVGLQGGFAQRSANISGLTWESQYVNGAYDPNASPNEGNLLTSFPYSDFSAGIVYKYGNTYSNMQGWDKVRFNVGFAYFHLNRPEMRYYSGGGDRLYGRMVFHANMRYDFPESRWSVVPSGYYMSQGPAREILFGGYARLRVKNGTKVTNLLTESGVAMGVHYRFGDAIIPEFYYDLGDYFIGISYDVNTSSYAEVSKAKGGIEITFRYANLNGALFKNKRPMH